MPSQAKKSAPKGRRKAQKPTKDEEVEVSTGLSLLIGHNEPPSKDLIYHLEQIAGYMDKAKTANGRVSSAKKAAKEAGVNVKAIMNTLTDLRLDPLELAQRLKQQAILYREKGMPVQMSLYEPAYGSIEDRALAEGWADGLAARNMNVDRWVEGAPGFSEYTRRWNDAQAENASKIGKSGE